MFVSPLLPSIEKLGREYTTLWTVGISEAVTHKVKNNTEHWRDAYTYTHLVYFFLVDIAETNMHIKQTYHICICDVLLIRKFS